MKKKKKINKKKFLVIGTLTSGIVASSIVIPIFVINDNKEKKDIEDIEEIIKILKNKELNERTLILEGDSTGKIIENNKDKIIAKIKELINESKLEEILIKVSIKNDVNISRIPQPIIVTIKKNKYFKKLEGENGLKVKRVKNIKEIKVESIQNYFKKLNNLKLLLPKTNYDSDEKILIAIKRKILNSIEGVSFEIDKDLITKKEGENNINSVANYEQVSSEYKITVGKETFVSRDFILKLNQEKLTRNARLNISVVKIIKNKITKTNLTLLAKVDTSNDVKILTAIKAQLKIDNPNLNDDDLAKITDSITTLTPGTKTPVTLTITVGTQTETVNINVLRPKTMIELDAEKVKNIKNKITKTDIILPNIIDTSNDGEILIAIKTQLKIDNSNLNDDDLTKITDSITTLTPGTKTPITLTITVGTQTETININVLRPKNLVELNVDIDEVERLLNTLTSKEITIAATSGSITDNKEAILTQIQALSGYSELDLKGVTISIKESDDIITPLGVDFEITLTKNGQSKDILIFKVKRNQTNKEIINEVKRLLNTLTPKEITIAATSGSITNNKEAILTQIQSLNGYSELDLKGVTISIKESNDIITPLGVDFEITLTKNGQSKDVSIFKVRRSQIPVETKNDINEVERLLNTLTPKEITIAATSGSITNNKEAILTKIQSLNGYSELDLKGVTISIKESDDIINLVGTNVEITLTKNGKSKNILIFKVRRSQNQNELNQNDINEVERLLNTLTSKEVTILASSGSITDNKEAILTQIQALSGYNELDLKGVTISIKESDDIINLVGTNVEITLSKGSQSKDLSIFKVRRSQNQNELNQNDINEVERLLNTLTSKEVTILASSGSITDNKEAILTQIQALSGYSELDLKGVTISIKESDDIIAPLGTSVEITLSKGSQSKDLSIFRVRRSQNQNELNQNDINEVERLLNTLTSKEVTILASSGSITDNKEAILTQIQALSGYSELDLKGVTISIKESDDIINLVGTNVEITLSKGSQSKDLSIFKVRRSQSQNELDQNDVNKIKQLLETLTPKEVTIDATSGSITTNKNLILEKIQALNNYPLNLNEVDISIKDNIDSITLEGISFTIKLSKGSVIEELIGFKVKRIENNVERISNSFKMYLKNENNLNLILPKTNYNSDAQILTAIKRKLLFKIFNMKIHNTTSLITKKQGSSKVNFVATHDEKANFYEITIGGEDFTLKLNQDKFDEEKRKKINTIKKLLKKPINLKIALPKDEENDYDEDEKILVAIKKNIFNKIKDISINVDSDLIIKKKNTNDIKSIAKHNEESTLYEITVDEKDFILELNQKKYNKEEKENIQNIKKYFENNENLKLLLPKINSSHYNQDIKILTYIKKKLHEKIKETSIKIINYLITKKIETKNINFIPKYNEIPISYEITINKENFILKLNQEKYTQNEMNKNKIIQKYLENSKNLNIVFSKDNTGFDYNNDDKILETIRKEIIDSIVEVKISDSYLITKKIGEKDINSIPMYNLNQQGVSYKIIVGNKEFELKLSKHKNKIEKIKYHLNFITNTFKITTLLPKDTIGNKYNEDNKILEAIRKKIIDSILGIENIDSNLINKKEGATNINLIPTYEEKEINYEITVDGEDFNLKLKQEKYTEEEKTKINVIKKYFETLSNLNLILPKTNYGNDNDILEAIKLKLKNNIEDIKNNSYLIVKKEGSSVVNSIAAHDQTSTQYEISIGKYEFTLNLNQEKFSQKEKIILTLEQRAIFHTIKAYLEIPKNLEITLPKVEAFNYNEDKKILDAIRENIFQNIFEEANNKYNILIIKTKDESDITIVANHNQPTTEYKITIRTINEKENLTKDFVLKLNQDEFTKEEKREMDINAIKTYLENEDNLNLILAKTTYNTDNSILDAIKLKIKNDIEGISSSDSHLIIKKVGSVLVTSVATHGETSTQYIITIGERDFILNLNQDEFTKEEKIINNFKTHLENEDNLNLILPKTNYNNDDQILEAIKTKLIFNVFNLKNHHTNLITKKQDSSKVNFVASHSQEANSYEITIDGKDFTLKLKQDI